MTNTRYNPSPVIGYPCGLIISDSKPIRFSSNNWFRFGGKQYNVHPYRDDLGGYPVRWIENHERLEQVTIRINDVDEYEVPDIDGYLYFTDDKQDAIDTAKWINGSDVVIKFRRVHDYV